MRRITIHRLYATKNDCYRNGVTGTPKGIQVHSTGATNSYLHRYVGPDDGLLGPNQYNNTWNQPNFKKCANAFIGRLQNGTVAIYQTLPWDMHCWLSASWTDANGKTDPYVKSANSQGFIGFEVCEDNRKNRDYFMDAVMDKSVNLCAYLCWKYSIPVEHVLDHSELHRMYMASDHGDITWWLKPFGYNMSMYRDAVKKAMAEGVQVTYIEGNKTWTDGQEEKSPAASAPAPAPEPTKKEPEATMSKQMVVVGDGYLNLRADANAASQSIGKLYPGDAVTVIAEPVPGWAFITSKHGNGYVDERYLAEPVESEPTEGPDENLVKALKEIITIAQDALKGAGKG